MPGVICFAGSFIFVLTRLRISYFPLTVIIYIYVFAMGLLSKEMHAPVYCIL